MDQTLIRDDELALQSARAAAGQIATLRDAQRLLGDLTASRPPGSAPTQ